jgi:alcohol dehydrogenase (cytochrome c)
MDVTYRIWLASVSATALLVAAPVAAEIEDYSPVTADRLENPEAGNWLMKRRSYDGQGHSALDEINRDNVGELREVWHASTGPYEALTDFAALPARGAHQSPAIVNDGVMFVTTHDQQVIAFDAATGEEHWRYRWELPAGIVPIHPTNRGVALYEDKVYFTTFDAHVVALDAKTGEHVWDHQIADWMDGYYMTLAPLVVDGKVMVGPSGGEFGIRGFIVALDWESGEEIWKTYTIPGPGEEGHDTWPGDTWERGGAPTWITGVYDPEYNIAYWGTGNAAPWPGVLRPGDNLYTTSTIGLDVETGEIKTHFQYQPNESWDWDEVVPPALIDLQNGDGTEKLALRFARNGYLYKFSREGGELSFIDAVPYVYQNVFASIDPETGRPEYDPENYPQLGERADFCPSAWGGRDWPADAYNPEHGLMFVSVNENHCGWMNAQEVEYEPGVLYLGSGLEVVFTMPEAEEHIGALQAWDINTLEKKWQVNFESSNWGPILSTGGDLVFVGGTSDAMFRAFDAETGDEVWSQRLDGGIVSPPTSFEIDGKQYIAAVTGWGVDADRMQGFINEQLGIDPEIPQGGSVYVFALPD